MRVTVLGTGTMGSGMVHSLLRAGHEVTAWNRHGERATPLAADGATVEVSAASAVQNAEVIITMLFDEDAVVAVAGEFLGAVPDGAIWMQCATVGLAGINRLAQLAAGFGVRMIDAPVVGTKKPAEEGSLVALVSGDADRITRVSPVLNAIAARTVKVGTEIGAASALKLACNAWVASLTVATAQSIAMCREFALDPMLFLQTIDGGPSNTPYAQLKGRMMIEKDFSPSFGIDGVVKDIQLMIDGVTGTATSARLLRPVLNAFQDASAMGYEKSDLAAVIESFTPHRARSEL